MKKTMDVVKSEPTKSPSSPYHLYTIPEAAKLLNISIPTLRILIGEGKMLTVPVGSRERRIPSFALLLWEVGEMYRVPQLLNTMLKHFGMEFDTMENRLSELRKVS